jgi:hypothetical protein
MKKSSMDLGFAKDLDLYQQDPDLKGKVETATLFAQVAAEQSASNLSSNKSDTATHTNDNSSLQKLIEASNIGIIAFANMGQKSLLEVALLNSSLSVINNEQNKVQSNGRVFSSSISQDQAKKDQQNGPAIG